MDSAAPTAPYPLQCLTHQRALWISFPVSPCRLREGANREILGIIVSYKVKVKLVVSRGG